MDPLGVLAEILRWLATLMAATVPFLVRWVWSLGTRVAVAENEIRYLKEEVAEDRKIVAKLPEQLGRLEENVGAIRERLDRQS